MRKQILREDGVKLSYMTTRRGKRKALEIVNDSVMKSFGKIRPFLIILNEHAPESHTAFELDCENRFSRCFICLPSSKNAFEKCLPLIAFDACTIKNSYKGVILACCAVDGAGQIVPLAYALASMEDTNNWNWFMQHLIIGIEMIQQRNSSITILSDREIGIHIAANTYLPLASHCYCVKHLEKNLKNMFKIGPTFMQRLWLAAKTTKLSEFNAIMTQLQGVDQAAYQYLDQLPRNCWTKVFSTLPKYGHVMSKVAESFNSWIGDSREDNHFLLIVKIYRKIMTLFYQRKAKYELSESMFSKEFLKPLNAAIEKSYFMDWQAASEDCFVETLTGNEYEVDLHAKKCSCGHYNDVLWPCPH